MKKMLLALLVVAVLMTAAVMPTSAEAGGLKALRAVRISETEVVIEFNKALDLVDGIDNNWISLRWEIMDENGNPRQLMWSECDLSLPNYEGVGDYGSPLQAGRTTYGEYWSDFDYTRVIICFNAEDLDAYAEKEGNQWYDMGCRAFLVIEEYPVDRSSDAMILDSVIAADGDTLAANIYCPEGWRDGVALEVEVDYNYDQSTRGETESWTFEETEAPVDETTAAGTEAGTAAGTDAGTSAGTSAGTNAPADKTEGGCGSAIAFAPAALVMMLGAALVASKKR